MSHSHSDIDVDAVLPDDAETAFNDPPTQATTDDPSQPQQPEPEEQQPQPPEPEQATEPQPQPQPVPDAKPEPEPEAKPEPEPQQDAAAGSTQKTMDDDANIDKPVTSTAQHDSGKQTTIDIGGDGIDDDQKETPATELELQPKTVPLSSTSGVTDAASQNDPYKAPTKAKPYIESPWQKFRYRIRHEILYSPWFEPLILFVITVNCVFLALDNPVKHQGLEQMITTSEYIFTTIYIIEMIIKFVGLGFFGHYEEPKSEEAQTKEQKESVLSYMVNDVFRTNEAAKHSRDFYKGYFLDGWNVLDFIIVIVGSIIPLFTSTSSVSSIRALRILRALRTIPRVPKLRTLVLTLVDSLPGLTGATILLAFFFIVFGIIGVQLFSGKLQQQCFDELGSMLVYDTLDSEYWAFCKTSSQCNSIAARIDSDDTNVYTCIDSNTNPNGGLESYDHIFYALLQVLQIVTMQDWSRWLYDLTRRTPYTTSIYFISITFIIAFFAMNLVLAVIVDTYSHSIDRVQDEEDEDNTLRETVHLMGEKAHQKHGKPIKQIITYETYPRKIRSLKQKVANFEQLFKEFSQPAVEVAVKKHELLRKTKLRVETDHGKGDDQKESWNIQLKAIAEDVKQASQYDLGLEEEEQENWQFSNRAVQQKALRSQMIEDMMLSFNRDLAYETWHLAKPIKDDYLKNKPMVFKWLHWVSTSEWFEKAIIFIIALNTAILAIEYPDMSEDLREALEALNYCFTFLFCAELVIKLIGLGPRLWWNDKFNVFDAIIVVISIIELFLKGSDGAAILAFRALRVLRVLRLLYQIRSLRVLLNSIIESFEPVFFLFLILSLFVFMFGVLGVQMFAGKLIDAKLTTGVMLARPWRFDTLWFSCMTMLQLFTGDGWPIVMGDIVTVTSKPYAIIPVITVIIGVYIFKNLFLAILINRMANQDDIQLMMDDLMREARSKQKLYPKDESKGIKQFEKDVKRIRAQRMGAIAQTKHQARIEKLRMKDKISGVSLKFFKPNNVVRVWLHDNIVNTDWFEWTINGFILVNCIFLAMSNPHVDDDSELGKALKALDILFTIIFVLEMLVKIIAYGLYESKEKGPEQDGQAVAQNLERKEDDEEEEEDFGPCQNAYLKSWWNRLDGFIVFIAILGLALPEVGFLRGLRAIRPIRIAIRVPQTKVVVKALMHSITPVLNAIGFSFFIVFVLSIVGVHLFSGEFARCAVEGEPFTLIDTVSTKAECLATSNSEWVNPGFNFDNVFIGLLSVFKISLFSNWFEELANGMAAKGYEKQIEPYNQPWAAVYFMGVVVVGGFFVFNIIISVVVDSFNRIKREEDTNALLTQEQAIWVRKRRYLSRFPLKDKLIAPHEPWRKSVFDLVTKDGFEYFIVGCILLNTIFLMTNYEAEPDSWTKALLGIEIAFVAIYTIEAVLKLLSFGVKKYFQDWWNVFDFVIVVVSIIGFGLEAGGGAAVIRLLRVARIVRLIKRWPVLRALFLTLVYAAPSLGNIGMLLMVIFFIWGIFGIEQFGKVVWNDGYGNFIPYDSNDGISESMNFEYFGNSLLILYRTATNDNWGAMLLAAGAQGTKCPRSFLERSEDDLFTYQCGSMWQSVLYFVSFGICGTLVMINLFIAVILDTYIDNVEFENRMQKLEVAREWILVWKEADKSLHKNHLKGRLPVGRFIQTLKGCPKLVGLMLEALNLRLNVEEAEAELDYNDTEEIARRSQQSYGRLDFVGPANAADDKVEVTWDHINAIMKTRRLRILCRLIHRGEMAERLVVFYSDALFAVASLVVGPEFRLLPYDSDKIVHIADWWDEKLEEAHPTF